MPDLTQFINAVNSLSQKTVALKKDRLPAPSPSLTRTDVCATVGKTRKAPGKAIETVHIYRLKDLDRRMKAAKREAARVRMYCVELHTATRGQQAPG